MDNETLAPQQVIQFYSVHDPYGAFANFAPYPIEMDGPRWPTVEHYFSGAKVRRDAACRGNSPDTLADDRGAHGAIADATITRRSGSSQG